MTFKIYPYKQGSRSASALAAGLNGRVLRRQGSRYRYNARDTIINWGSGACPYPCLNNPRNVEIASNKLLTFQRFTATNNNPGESDVSIPQYWTRQEDIPDGAFPIVCRTVLRGHSGNGIVIANDRRSLVNAPLYVQYVKKNLEFRIHVGITRNGPRIIKAQRKARRRETPDAEVNWQVRNLAGGFIYAILEEREVPASVLENSIAAIQSLGLDFGAVDVIYNQRNSQAYVLEVNTACGIEGSTADAYTAFFNER